MIFAIRSEDEVKEMSFLLTYDVQFVTAHPCVPSVHSIMVLEANEPALANSAPEIDEGAGLRRPSGPHTMFTGQSLLPPSIVFACSPELINTCQVMPYTSPTTSRGTP